MARDPDAVKNRPFLQRLKFAAAGLGAAWRRERSFRTQVWIAGMVGLALVALRPAAVWWGVILLTIALVLATELFNAAVEALTDHLHPERHPEIRTIKDMAAGAVLVASLAAVAVAAALVVASVF
jgi:undecaprenol kinase